MNNDNSNTTSGAGSSWAQVAGRAPVKKQPTITLSFKAQERYREEHSTPAVDPNHDSRFDPIVFTKPKAPTVIRQQATANGGKNKQSQSDVDMRKIERGEIRLAKSDRELAQKIQQYRNAKGWSQDVFNTKCGFPVHTIRNYENMSATADQRQIDTMKRILGVSDLYKPKAIKVTPDDSV